MAACDFGPLGRDRGLGLPGCPIQSGGPHCRVPIERAPWRGAGGVKVTLGLVLDPFDQLAALLRLLVDLGCGVFDRRNF
jgi:hypothetical protein